MRIAVIGTALIAALALATLFEWINYGDAGPASRVAAVAGGAAAKEPPPSTEPLRTTLSARAKGPATPARSHRRLARLVLTASRGDCWLVVRKGSAQGPVLYQGTVASGDTVRFSGKRIWLRMGAASNLDAILNGEPVRDFAQGTVDMLASAKGLRAVV